MLLSRFFKNPCHTARKQYKRYDERIDDSENHKKRKTSRKRIPAEQVQRHGTGRRRKRRNENAARFFPYTKFDAAFFRFRYIDLVVDGDPRQHDHLRKVAEFERHAGRETYRKRQYKRRRNDGDDERRKVRDLQRARSAKFPAQKYGIPVYFYEKPRNL